MPTHRPPAPTAPQAITLAVASLLLSLQPASSAAAQEPPPPLLRPVAGELATAFDGPAQRWQAGHRGADLRAEVGDAVLAPATGIVAFAGTVVDREVLSIDHPSGHRSTLEPIRATVRAGDRVRAGQVVGYVMAGHDCSGTCLHWGLREGRDYLDPMPWTAATGIRLLPHDAQAPTPPPPAPAELTAELRGIPGRVGGRGLVRPSSGPVTSRFGMRRHPVLGIWKLHDGLDLGAPCGAPVRTVAAGRVVLTEANLAYGNRVVVEHGDLGGRRLRTSYNHLASISVNPGQEMASGARLGAVGSTGYSTGCHLHFMVWEDGRVVDPQRWLG